MPLRVYVAGASNALERVKAAEKSLWAAGVETVSDWVASVEESGEGNPADASRNQRVGWALDDIEDIRQADVFWLLVPYGTSHGAFWEFGYARCVAEEREREMHLVASGNTARSIFCSLADEEFATDDEALRYIAALAKQETPA